MSRRDLADALKILKISAGDTAAPDPLRRKLSISTHELWLLCQAYMPAEVLPLVAGRIAALLKLEQAAQPKKKGHRQTEATGLWVEILYKQLGDLAEAKRRVAEIRGMTFEAASKAWERHIKNRQKI